MGTTCLQPKYYKNFRCVGGSCLSTCCKGWEILWLGREIDKIKNADCSPELQRLSDTSFEKADGLFRIKLKDDRDCPFHGCDGLCMIQKELGEDYLSTTCTIYPRKHHMHNGICIRKCVSSCPAVIELLISDKDSAALEQVVDSTNRVIDSNVTVTSEKDIEKRRILTRFITITEAFMEILASDTRPLSSSLIVGAMIADKLTKLEKSDEVDGLRDMLKLLVNQFSSPAIEQSIAGIKANHEIKFKLVNNMLLGFFEGAYNKLNISALHDGERVVTENYLEGLRKFYEVMPDYTIRNIAMNMFLDCNMPFYDKGKSIFENYCLFAMNCACFELMAAAVGFSSENIRDEYILRVSELCRGISNNQKHSATIMKNLSDTGFNSPAHIALIVK